MQAFLANSEYINWQHSSVSTKARELALGATTTHVLIQNCFEFVRDEIKHSWDHQLNPVTCSASDVLTHGTGYCYAKSHLLAALLRANGIPAGLCYQRLTLVNDQPPFCLHGLNAVYLDALGWFRLDARGNKRGVDAQFSPPKEQLAFPIVVPGEADLPEVWPEPLPVVVHALTHYRTVQEVFNHLPDLQLFTAKK